MKQIIVEVRETDGRVKTSVRDGTQINHTPIEAGVICYLGDAIQQAIDTMYDGAEQKGGAQ